MSPEWQTKKISEIEGKLIDNEGSDPNAAMMDLAQRKDAVKHLAEQALACATQRMASRRSSQDG